MLSVQYYVFCRHNAHYITLNCVMSELKIKNKSNVSFSEQVKICSYITDTYISPVFPSLSAPNFHHVAFVAPQTWVA